MPEQELEWLFFNISDDVEPPLHLFGTVCSGIDSLMEGFLLFKNACAESTRLKQHAEMTSVLFGIEETYSFEIDDIKTNHIKNTRFREDAVKLQVLSKYLLEYHISICFLGDVQVDLSHHLARGYDQGEAEPYMKRHYDL